MNQEEVNQRIKSQELGAALRPGLNEVKEYFSGKGDAKSEDRVDRFLKGVRTSAHLAAQENNELLMLLKFGKVAGATPIEMKPIFSEIAGRFVASGEVAPKKPKALAGK